MKMILMSMLPLNVAAREMGAVLSPQSDNRKPASYNRLSVSNVRSNSNILKRHLDSEVDLLAIAQSKNDVQKDDVGRLTHLGRLNFFCPSKLTTKYCAAQATKYLGIIIFHSHVKP